MTMKRKLLLIVMNLRSTDNENFYETLIGSHKESMGTRRILPGTMIKSALIINSRLVPPEPQ